jgi:hypothetical protein
MAFANCWGQRIIVGASFKGRAAVEERRKRHRHRADRAAKIAIGQASLVDCTVRDINAGGVGLIAQEVAELPSKLELTLDGGRTYRPGRIVWRGSARAGVKFGD